MSHELIRPDGMIRRDEAALGIVSAALRRDPAITELVDDIGSEPVAPGSFGLLMPASLRRTGEDVLVKVNANEHERRWLPAIGAIDPQIVPEVHGDGEHIDDVALGWMVMERLPHTPPGFGAPEWYAPLLNGAFRWHEAARRVALPPWHDIDGPWLRSWIDQAAAADRDVDMGHLLDRFDRDWAWVCDVCGAMQPAHGDVHFFNAGSREPGLPDALVLFDPIPRAAHWPYDFANSQTLTNREDEPPLVVLAAHARRAHGLPTPDDGDVERLSALFCAWLSVMWHVMFKDVAPQRRASAARYVDQALRT